MTRRMEFQPRIAPDALILCRCTHRTPTKVVAQRSARRVFLLICISRSTPFQGILPGMARPFHLRRATRRRLVWMVALLLAWQQVALAAYVCRIAPETMGQVTALASPAAMTAVDGDCADMGDAATRPLCQQHCVPDRATQVDVRPAPVPLSPLTPIPPMLMSVAIVASQPGRTLARLDHRRTLPPTPRLLFCSLLI